MITAQSRTLSSLLFATLCSFFILGIQIPGTLTATTNTLGKTTTNKVVSPEAPPTKEKLTKHNQSTNNSLKAPLPDFAHIYNTQEKKQQFFSYLIPIITSVNKRVTHEREKIKALQKNINNTDTLNSVDDKDLSSIAKKYRVDVSKGFDSTFFTNLLNKVDRIPPSLVLAQAANESAWGTSRFALEGNNLFGQWCFSKGCGLVPEHRSDGASHEVAKFSSVFGSVESYVLNLNRHSEYKQLRAIRNGTRQAGKSINGVDLANGLEGYSERGLEYVNEIQSIIRFNNLSSLDKNA